MKRQLEVGKQYMITTAGKTIKFEYRYGYIHVYRDDTRQAAWIVDKQTRKGIHLIFWAISTPLIRQYWPWTLIREVNED